MTIVYALTAAIKEWNARLEGLTSARAGNDDAEWWEALDQSLLGRGVARSRDWLSRVYSESAVAQWGRNAAGAMPPGRRARFVAAVALIGAPVHIALMGRTEVIGLWWLILPAMAMTFGIGALLMSRVAATSVDDGALGRQQPRG